MSQVRSNGRGFTLIRQLDAPRELVFQAWTDPDHLHWFADTEAARAVEREPTTVDLSVGGTWRIDMTETEDRAYPTGGVYLEIDPPGRLVFRWGATDGWPPLDPDDPDASPIVTLTLDDIGGKTEMTLQVGFSNDLTHEAVEEWLSTGMKDGWSQTIDRLAPYLAGLTVS